MKTVKRYFMTGLIAIALTACGTQAPVAATGYYNSAGQWVNGVNTVGGNACISSMAQPLSISFTANQIALQQNRFFAGNIPQFGTAAGPHGTVSMGGGIAQQMGAVTLQKQSQNGSVQMSLNTQAMSASGTIQINPQALYNSGVMNTIYNSGMNYGGNMGGSMGASVCITSIALDVVYIAQPSYGYGQMSTGVISQALVYLYLSNGQVAQAPIAL